MEIRNYINILITFLMMINSVIIQIEIDPPNIEEHFVFSGIIFTNGSRPSITTNITDQAVLQRITNILTDYSEERFVKKKYLSISC